MLTDLSAFGHRPRLCCVWSEKQRIWWRDYTTVHQERAPFQWGALGLKYDWYKTLGYRIVWDKQTMPGMPASHMIHDLNRQTLITQCWVQQTSKWFTRMRYWRGKIFFTFCLCFCPLSFCPIQAFRPMCPFAFSVHFLFSDKPCFHASCHPGRSYPPHPTLLLPPIRLPAPLSDVAEVQVSLLYPPVWGDVFWLVALHVLLHGGEAGAVFQADGALVRRGSVVGAQVFDHGRVIPGALVAQLTLKRLLTCREKRENIRTPQWLYVLWWFRCHIWLQTGILILETVENKELDSSRDLDSNATEENGRFG